jgi:outer membrane immunogenic protein
MKIIAFALATATALALTATTASAEGLRVEVHGGWDRVSNGGVEEDGILYGIGAGYDVRVGENAFVGIDLSADLGTGDDCEEDVLVNGDEACVAVRRDLAAGIRAGVNVTPTTSLYALAGYTNARFRLDYTTAANVTTRTSENLDGIRVGAGIQQAFGERIYGKIEYRYSNYEAGTDRHNVLVGVGLTF